MDVGRMSMNMSMIDTTSKIGVAVLSKEMDTNEAMGQGIVKMIDSAATSAMELSVNPGVGGNFDMRV